ncbi:MAG: phage integrase SAM-like domain-containing protein, partial [Ignavibacteriaceae bacterium]
MEPKYLKFNDKSPFYQVLYKRNGKKTTISTGTADRNEAEKFLNHFDPDTIQEKPKRETSITLKAFIKEYKQFIKDTYSKAYYERAVTPSFNKLEKFLPNLPLDMISSRNIDQFISSIMSYSRSAASLYHRTLKAAFNKALAWNYIKESPFNKIKAPKVIKNYPIFIGSFELDK